MGSTLAACSPPAEAVHRPHARPPSLGGSQALACEVPLPASWAAALKAGIIPTSPGESLLLFTVSADGRAAFATDYTPAWYGIVEVSVPSGARRRIEAFSSAGAQVLFGYFDGRWLVWVEEDSPQLGQAAWQLRAWDSHAASIWTLAQSESTGSFPVSPDLSHGMVTWTSLLTPELQPQAKTRLHLYSLRARRDSVVGVGQIRQHTFVWPSLIWSSIGNGGVTGLHLASGMTGAPMPTPTVLKAVREDVELVRSTGTIGSLAWVGGDYSTVKIWRAGRDTATVLFRRPPGDVQFATLSDEMLAWYGADAGYVADLRSRAYAKVTPPWGWAAVNGKALAISYQPHYVKASHPPLAGSVVTVDQLPPLPACPTSPGPRGSG
ncbi:MAG: hypothetical protein ACREPA_05810 [Candidatus Dormibacteraceae bacterium]